MIEHIKFEVDLKPVEEGLPEDNRVYWIRRKDRGCLRQAAYMGQNTKYKPGWYLFPGGSLVTGVTHYAESPQIGPTPCEEAMMSQMAAERHND